MMRPSSVLASVLTCMLAIACTDNGGNGDGGSDGAVGDSPTSDAPSDGGDGGDGAPVPAICKSTSTWGAGTLVPISTGQSDFLGAVTPDELTIAWMTTAGSVMYADRNSGSDPFGTAQTLTGPIALDHVTLSPDGLTLIVVTDTRYMIVQATRASRGAQFGSQLDNAPFAKLDPLPTEIDAGLSPPHGLFADPMLSPDGQFFYYSQYGVTTLTMHESYRAKGATTPWGQGRNLLETQLAAPDTSGKRMHPTGMSIDDLTLFFWDEVAGTERMAFRDGSIKNNTFNQFVDIGAHQNAVPTAGCGRIYFSGSGAGGLDLFFADSN